VCIYVCVCGLGDGGQVASIDTCVHVYECLSVYISMRGCIHLYV